MVKYDNMQKRWTSQMEWMLLSVSLWRGEIAVSKWNGLYLSRIRIYVSQNTFQVIAVDEGIGKLPDIVNRRSSRRVFQQL